MIGKRSVEDWREEVDAYFGPGLVGSDQLDSGSVDTADDRQMAAVIDHEHGFRSGDR